MATYQAWSNLNGIKRITIHHIVQNRMSLDFMARHPDPHAKVVTSKPVNVKDGFQHSSSTRVAYVHLKTQSPLFLDSLACCKWSIEWRITL